MAATDIRFRRLVIDPRGLDIDNEVVCLSNTGPDDVDMTGWKLMDTLLHPEFRTTFEFPPFVLLAGARVSIHSRAGQNDAQNLFWNRVEPVWNNEGDRAVLLDAEGAEIANVGWTSPQDEGRIVDTEPIAAEIAAAGLTGATSRVRWTTEGPTRGAEIFWQEFGDDLVFHRGYDDSIPAGTAVPERPIIRVSGRFARKYLDLGGPRVLGRPLSRARDLPVPGGHRQDFEGGSLFLSRQTRTSLVKGEILKKYLGPEVGGPSGPLGLGMPVSDEGQDASGLFFSEFEHGSIWFTGETGAQALKGIVVEFRGFHCIGRQNGISLDEPYFAVEAAHLLSDLSGTSEMDAFWATVAPASGPPYGRVDDGTIIPDTVTVFAGRAAPFRIKATLWENDEGDPNALRSKFRNAVAAVGVAVAALVPGAASAIATNPSVQELFTDIINGVAGTNDDLLGRGEFALTSRREIAEALAHPPAEFAGIQFHRKVFFTDGDASYDAFFLVRPL